MKTIAIEWLNLFTYCLRELKDYGVDVELCNVDKVRSKGEDDSWSRGFWEDSKLKY